MFSRYNWSVDFGIACSSYRYALRPPYSDLLREVPSNAFQANGCPYLAPRSNVMVPDLDTKRLNLEAVSASEEASALTCFQVSKRSNLLCLIRGMAMLGYIGIVRRHALLPNLKDGVSALLRR